MLYAAQPLETPSAPMPRELNAEDYERKEKETDKNQESIESILIAARRRSGVDFE